MTSDQLENARRVQAESLGVAQDSAKACWASASTRISNARSATALINTSWKVLMVLLALYAGQARTSVAAQDIPAGW